MIETVIVMAKECLPGRVKTRLSPPLTPDQAARVAAASLDDTLRVARSLGAPRLTLSYDGNRAPEGSADFDIIPQRGDGLDERIADALDHATGTTLVLGMDTPQASLCELAPVVDAWPHDIDAWFGPALDGGFWALALRVPDGRLVRGVAMSRDDTGARQLDRLRRAGLRIGTLDTLVDIDTVADLRAVAVHPTAVRLREILDTPDLRLAMGTPAAVTP